MPETALALLTRSLCKSEGNTPPKAVQSACKRGLDLAADYGGPGLTDGAKARARSMANGESQTDAHLARMNAFFSRHQGNRADPSDDEPTPGAVAWLLWGGDAGQSWAGGQADDDSAEKADDRPKYKKQGLVAPGGAWAEAKRQAEGKANPDAYAQAVYNRMTKKSRSALDVLRSAL